MRAILSTLLWTMIPASLAMAQPPSREPIRPAHADVEYKQKSTSGRPLTLDVYHPAGDASSRGWPAVVWIHGGAWLGGDKHLGLPYVLEEGIAVVAIRYRLSGEAIWPAQIEDCKAAIRFLRAHASDYQLDPRRLAVAGASAGGHLAAVVGTTGNDRRFDVGDFLEHSSRVVAVVDLFGPTNVLAMIGQPSSIDHAAANAPEALLLGGAIQTKPEMVRSADPMTYIDAGTPPMLIIHGVKDNIVPIHQSELLHEALREAKVSSELIKLENGGHGGPAFDQPEVTRRVVEFLKTHLTLKD